MYICNLEDCDRREVCRYSTPQNGEMPENGQSPECNKYTLVPYEDDGDICNTKKWITISIISLLIITIGVLLCILVPKSCNNQSGTPPDKPDTCVVSIAFDGDYLAFNTDDNRSYKIYVKDADDNIKSTIDLPGKYNISEIKEGECYSFCLEGPLKWENDFKIENNKLSVSIHDNSLQCCRIDIKMPPEIVSIVNKSTSDGYIIEVTTDRKVDKYYIRKDDAQELTEAKGMYRGDSDNVYDIKVDSYGTYIVLVEANGGEGYRFITIDKYIDPEIPLNVDSIKNVINAVIRKVKNGMQLGDAMQEIGGHNYSISMPDNKYKNMQSLFNIIPYENKDYECVGLIVEKNEVKSVKIREK
ncbi:MAG: hypothetical protein IKJ59_06870 [Clostridia bacterium]|nr:hypothetical protein [Bacteroidales bacterium]MBR3918441.1 hypothetical protein [Clostridia bacterium]